MKPRIALLCLCGLLAVLSSCSKPLASASLDFNSQCWGIKDTVNLNFQNEDVEQTRIIRFPVTFTTEYKYSNIFIRVLITPPSGKENAANYQFQLMDEAGQWLGETSGGEVSFNLNLGEAVKFTEKGEYKLRIQQFMRDDQLCGIKHAGIEVIKAE